MQPRDTRTGSVLEQMIVPALRGGGYLCSQQVHVGPRLGGGKHLVDFVATDRAGVSYLVSVKWQQVAGTAEQKVPYEAMCLAEAVLASRGEYAKAYLVLGGDGWKLREFYTGGGLHEHLRHGDLVTILSFESFVARANRGQL
ncbi:MAG TPA: PD-(D/E)XK nuclease superfamily protein [Dehalococcoidia bacterium]|nr:PD-(D/E)XK nuclease superfamily protein [Dehalococcoidia bacterium]